MSVDTELNLTQALNTILEVWDETLDPPRAPGGGGGGGKPASRSPLPDDAFDCRKHAAAVLGAWCDLTVTELGLCVQVHTRGRHQQGALCLRRTSDLPSGDVVALAAWLADHVVWLADQELGPVAALELTEAAKDLDRIAHPDRPDALYIGRCPVGLDVGTPCGRRLYWPRGALTVDCSACGTRDDVYGWVKRMGDEMPDDLTAVQLSTYLTRALDVLISHELVRKWVSRGVLPQLDRRDERHRPLYSAPAALVLADAHLKKSQRRPPRRVA